MTKYDYFVAGRWRNRAVVKQVLDIVRDNHKSAYCFIENLYEGEKIEFSMDGDVENVMQKLEGLSSNDPLVDKIFQTDIEAERQADNFLLVLPAGVSGHIEAGVAYGLGKKCYAVGKPEKTETLYKIFDKIFPTINDLDRWLKSSHNG
jgi:hypothetical protein